MYSSFKENNTIGGLSTDEENDFLLELKFVRRSEV